MERLCEKCITDIKNRDKRNGDVKIEREIKSVPPIFMICIGCGKLKECYLIG